MQLTAESRRRESRRLEDRDAAAAAGIGAPLSLLKG